MRKSLHCYTLSALIAALLAGCGGSQQPIGAANALPQIVSTTSSGYRVLHSFNDRHDGQVPKAGLISVNGTLYGTTYAGGASADGTTFSITTNGAEKVLYSFQGGNDGANPAAGLLAINGLLYGTTEYGGIPEYGGCNAGTVFRVSTSGTEDIVYRFYGNGCHGQYYYDGANPLTSLISVRGKFYGTTSNGGINDYGTLFRVSPRGREKVLHSFEVHTDGAVPNALVDVKGTLYGTTVYGGGYSATSDFCCGSIYSMSTTGDLFDRLYVFHGPNGANPQGALINIHGTLYGTTAYGGTSEGIAFSMPPSGSITTLHNFGSGTDGSNPFASLLKVGEVLYGTTSTGGAYGKGTVFSMSLTASEAVLHSFGYGSDGATPLAGLIDLKGTLYGTTSAGGTQGYGTVFALRIKP